MVYDPLSLATDSGYYVFFFITLYKNPYLGLVKYCQVAGTIFLQELALVTRIFLLNPYNMYHDSYIYILTT